MFVLFLFWLGLDWFVLLLICWIFVGGLLLSCLWVGCFAVFGFVFCSCLLLVFVWLVLLSNFLLSC